MTYDELRKRFLDFWQSEPRSCKQVPAVSLVPNVDSTLLFVNAGMFPLAPYLAGQRHPLGTRLCNIQRCLRTKYDDMKEIGDNRHTSMFEMMGNWSLGDYTKAEQIPWMLKLHVEEYGLDPSRLYVTVYGGDEHISRDEEAIEAWKKAFREYGIEAEFSEDITKIPSSLEVGREHKYRIFPYGRKDNWWKRGDVAGELGGPSSELFYDTGNVERVQDKYHINDDSGRFLEVGNSVFMEYRLDETLHWIPLVQKNIDFGGGLERVLMCVQNKTDIFETDLYLPIIQRIVELSGKEYKTNDKVNEYTKYFRILADHGRAATFILADGVIPSNKDQGYILRRFIRRLVRFGMKLELPEDFAKDVAGAVIERMSDIYPNLKEKEELILSEMSKEESKFRSTLQKGLKELGKIDKESFNGEVAFRFYETYGFPVEMMLDEIEMGEEEADKLLRDFSAEERKHRELSKIGAEHKFKGGLADSSEITTRLHTAHHLLLRALQIVLGEGVKQKGSNITAERLRIDFNYPEKLTSEQLKKIEDIVNEQIEKGLEVRRVEMSKEVAEGIGAEREFGQSYPDTVSVYFVGLRDGVEPEEAKRGDYFSAEFCGGPHVSNTREIGRFRIVKEESSGAGVRRIKGIIEL